MMSFCIAYGAIPAHIERIPAYDCLDCRRGDRSCPGHPRELVSE
ncbi:hypothetical protein SEA_CAIN_52 [Mycobacterium phage Cain]|uniref:Uncharacterized protein n=1 Tax=Mycobacterium phage Bryler TaxID=2653755 RepID=A0A5Q2WRF4_9CAUD|nr:hypothetical protein I5G79_gp46 [Mycobacterium phage Bryler]ASR85350.1 hypothetical protein SEA_PHRANK_52 [Mycobacterium phage Phrank]ASR85451.1 hypothetical protein SEA_CAIN_52 [Mycobacterium phage Cain]QGH80427.1 hypothetical protein SEA_BRYLER_52 [Mycobacterium phage Bryler]